MTPSSDTLPPAGRKPELLAPAGTPEKLETAIHFGADAVYIAGKDFSLRNFSGNFSRQEMDRSIALCRSRGVKSYVAVNIYSRNNEQAALLSYLRDLGEMAPDALIVSDPGIIHLIRTHLPDMPIHLSTQANTTNTSCLSFWKPLGVTRVNLARELSITEVREISRPNILETEIFIHGAMCISYSGRCLLSSYLTGRDSNRGLCSHPCRWQYHVVEEKRPGRFHPVSEDNRGTYLFNSRDLCTISEIPALMTSGVTAFKIEGRMKGISYLASVVKTYREAMDAWWRDPKGYEPDPRWQKELAHLYHREYCTGFYFDAADQTAANDANRTCGQIHAYIGKVADNADAEGTRPILDIKNSIRVGEHVEILAPRGVPAAARVVQVLDDFLLPIEHGRPNTRCTLELDLPCRPGDILRKPVAETDVRPIARTDR